MSYSSFATLGTYSARGVNTEIQTIEDMVMYSYE